MPSPLWTGASPRTHRRAASAHPLALVCPAMAGRSTPATARERELLQPPRRGRAPPPTSAARAWAAPARPPRRRRRLPPPRRAAPPRAARALLPHAGLGPGRRGRPPGGAAAGLAGGAAVRGPSLPAA